jgi:hypothetical protein
MVVAVIYTSGLFGIMAAVAVQNIIRLEIYQNDFFIFKKLFLRSLHQNNLKIYKK